MPIKRKDPYKDDKNSTNWTVPKEYADIDKFYLKKMNKGVRLIDNIAALKFCKENQINNIYNIITNCPNEERLDFEETKKKVQLFQQYLDHPQICYLRVVFGSPMQRNPEQFNIERLKYSHSVMVSFPEDIYK